MKFGNMLKSHLYSDWEEHYVAYGRLKQKLKEQHAATSLSASTDALDTNGAFMVLLEAELVKVQEFYGSQSEEMAAEVEKKLAELKGLRADLVQVVLEELNSQLQVLLEYCDLNHQAFAKITKKFIKCSYNVSDAREKSQEFISRVDVSEFADAARVNELLGTVLKSYKRCVTNGNGKQAARLLLNSWSNDVRSKPRKATSSLADKSAFIIDMDGVIYHGERILKGVPEFIAWLRKTEKKFLFLTNSSNRSPAELSQKLARLGIQVSKDHFYTSALATASFVASQMPNGSAFVIGDPGLHMALYEVGYTMNNINPDYVIVGETRDFVYDKIEQAVNLVRSGSRLIGTNCDKTDKLDQRFAPACGSLIMGDGVIESASGRKAYFMGKPNPLVVKSALAMLGCKAADACIVGDRMDTDIVCGLEASIDTALVLSGVTAMEDLNHFAYRPKYIFNGVGDIVAAMDKSKKACN